MSDPNQSRPESDLGADASDPKSDSTDAQAPGAEVPTAADATTDAAEASSDQDQVDKPTEDPSPPADGSTGPADETAATGDGADGEGDGESTPESGEAAADEELPEWEPLTPEIVEDEAIRGDFMLRWAVVLLAFLLGCREIGESLTLVRVRTGEAIAANGFWPPATDVFSYTAGESPWINPAWLFDLILSGVHGVGGDIGLSLLTALLAAVTFYLLVNISRAQLPTWWTAVCGAAALLMAQSQFTALPELITLLGTTWMLRGLVKWSESGDSKNLWCLAGSLVVWSNLDPRAFIGWLILAAYVGGTYVSRSSNGNTLSFKDAGKAVGLGLLALMVNPAGWNTLLSPLQIYGADNAVLLSYAGFIDTTAEAQLLSMLDTRFRDSLSLASISALVLAGIAVLSCVANIRRVDGGLLGAFVLLAVVAVICSHELGALCVVACVLASLNGQDWYRDRCRQEYSTDTLEVLWSRFGRAATVLTLAVVAWLAISGRMVGPGDRRVGIGFASWLQATIDGTAQDLAEIPDSRLFTMRLEHGDLLIWHGRPAFIDSRVGLYQGEVLNLHDQARFALRSALDQSRSPASTASQSLLAKQRSEWRGKTELWKATFERFDVRFVTPRLWGANPDYDSLFDLLRSGHWQLASLGSTLAALAPRTTDGPDGSDQALPLDLVEVAFRDCRTVESENQRVEFPRARTQYQQFLSLQSRSWSPAAIRARHEQVIATAGFAGQIPLRRSEAIALASMSLRDAMTGTVETPTNDSPYRTIADAYGAIRLLENQAMGNDVGPVAIQRYFQRIHYLRQALTLAPNDPELLSSLAQEYFSAQRWDLSLQMIDRFLASVRESTEFRQRYSGLARQLQAARAGLAERLSSINARMATALKAESPNVVDMASALRLQGFPLRAVQLLDENKLGLSGNIMAQIEYGVLLIECGRLEEASGVVGTFDSFPEGSGIPFLWTLHAAWLDQARGDVASAILRCERRLRQTESGAAQALLAVAPFVQPLPQLTGNGNTWPVSQAVVAGRVLAAQDESAILRWTIANAYLESGQCEQAAKSLQILLETEPGTVLRPLIALYLELLTGETIPIEPPSEQVPILFTDGPEDPKPTPVQKKPDADAPGDAASDPPTGGPAPAESPSPRTGTN